MFLRCFSCFLAILGSSLFVPVSGSGPKVDETSSTYSNEKPRSLKESASDLKDRSEHWTFSSPRFSLAASEGAEWKQGKEHHLELKTGSYVIEAGKETTVVTPKLHIALKPRALAVVQITDTGDRVFAVLENIKVTSNKHFVSLRFGEQCYVCDHEPPHDELMGLNQVGLRQLRVLNAGAGRHIAVMEYSLIQLAERDPVLSQIVHSGHNHDRNLKSRLMKGAAVLNMVTSGHGYYTGNTR